VTLLNLTFGEKGKLMKKITNTFKLAVVSAMFVASTAHSALITFGGQDAADGTVTSVFVDPANVLDPSGNFFLETFDLLPDTIDTNIYPDDIAVSEGCTINAFASPITIDPGAGGFGVTTGQNDWAAHDTSNTTCFGFTPMQGGDLPTTVTIDYAGLLTGPGSFNYLGMWFASIDDYNSLSFGNVVDDVFVEITSLTGSAILDVLETTSGDRSDSKVYVNVFFEEDEHFTAFRFHTTDVAFELDNIVVGRVPEPESLFLLGFGLLAFTSYKRRKTN